MASAASPPNLAIRWVHVSSHRRAPEDAAMRGKEAGHQRPGPNAESDGLGGIRTRDLPVANRTIYR